MPKLLRAAELFERGEKQDAEITLLLGAGSSPGGGRPKALVFDAENGEHYLAKFPSIKDRVDVVGIEAATMSLAGKAGALPSHQHDLSIAAPVRCSWCSVSTFCLIEAAGT